MLTTDHKKNLVTARQTILRAVDGFDDADLPTAAAMLDTILRETCPHDPASWHTAPDANGRILTTCYQCGVSWYEGRA